MTIFRNSTHYYQFPPPAPYCLFIAFICRRMRASAMGMRRGSHCQSDDGTDRRMRTARSVSTSYWNHNSNMTVVCVLILYAINYILFKFLCLIQLQLWSLMYFKKKNFLSCHCILSLLVSENNYFCTSLFINFAINNSLHHRHCTFNYIFYRS